MTTSRSLFAVSLMIISNLRRCTFTSVPAINYTPAAHRTLIVLRCAKSHRPFNSVADEDYQAEVQMLQPGTILPHPSTVSHDIKAIYLTMSILVRQYFMVCILAACK